MANVKHSLLSGADIHEPKNIQTSAAGSVYVGTGSNTGAWKQIATDANATTTTMEPKSIGTSSEGDIYVSDGVGSGTWVAENARIQIYEDPLDQTRSITTLDTDLDYTFTYSSNNARDFTYNDTTKEMTYTGTVDVIARINQVVSLTKTGGAASPLVEFFIQRKPSGGSFSKIQQSRIFANFTSSETSTNSMTFLLELAPNDVIKLGLRTDGNFNLTGKNVVCSIQALYKGIT